jgi:phage gp16-like protein
MHLSIDRDSRIALTILKKVYGQRGSGRKEGALFRGLNLSDREEVQRVITEMISQGWILRTGNGSNIIYVGLKDRRAAARQALATPSDFKL